MLFGRSDVSLKIYRFDLKAVDTGTTSEELAWVASSTSSMNLWKFGAVTFDTSQTFRVKKKKFFNKIPFRKPWMFNAMN